MKKLLSILILILFTTTVKAQLELPYPVKVVNPRSLDHKYLYNGNRPYTDTAEVNATIPLGIRHKGLIVNVNNTLWWYKDSVLNNSLVQIQLGGGISKTYADWGLSNVNDSTLKVDSSVLLTKLKGLNLIDSFRTSINATTPIIYTPSTSNIYLPKGSADSSGYISSTDWAAFDDKLNKSDTASMLTPYTNASILTSGKLSDNRLSSNVPLLNANNNFTGTNTFSKSSLKFNESKSSNVIGVLNVAEDNYVGWVGRNADYGNTRLIDLSNINSITAYGISAVSFFASSYISCNNFSGQLQGYARFVHNSAPLNKKNWFYQTNIQGILENYSTTDNAVDRYVFMTARKATSPDYYVANVTYTTVDTFQINTSKIVLNANTDVKKKLTTSGFAPNITTKNANYTLTDTDYTILANANDSTITITLPTAVGRSGQIYNIIRIDNSGNDVNIVTTSGQTINDDTSITLSAKWQKLVVQSTGANWVKLN